MDGNLGLAAWRWLFILDFCLGIPVAIFGFFNCPSTPVPFPLLYETFVNNY